MTLVAFCAAAALLVAQAAAPDERTEAVRLARDGAHQEALRRFRDQAIRNPADLDARIWMAQLLVWSGEPAEAERTFRSVLEENPEAVDALLGLGILMGRQGKTGEALTLLTRAERLDPARADTLSALGRTHRMAGRTTAALSYYRRAAGLAPSDADVRRGLELTRAQHDHRVDTSFTYERLPAGRPVAQTGSIDLSLRAADGVRVTLHQQVQSKFGVTESRTGAGLDWRVARTTAVRGELSVAPGATVLPRATGGMEIERNTRYADIRGGVRFARFGTADVWVAAPGVTFPVGERLLISTRYFMAVTAFDQLGETVVNHSAGVSLRARVRHRLWTSGGYARGNESFETLSIERIGRFQADTFSGGLRIDTPALAWMHVNLECQRSEARNVWRLTTGLTRRF